MAKPASISIQQFWGVLVVLALCSCARDTSHVNEHVLEAIALRERTELKNAELRAEVAKLSAMLERSGEATSSLEHAALTGLQHREQQSMELARLTELLEIERTHTSDLRQRILALEEEVLRLLDNPEKLYARANALAKSKHKEDLQQAEHLYKRIVQDFPHSSVRGKAADHARFVKLALEKIEQEERLAVIDQQRSSETAADRAKYGRSVSCQDIAMRPDFLHGTRVSFRATVLNIDAEQYSAALDCMAGARPLTVSLAKLTALAWQNLRESFPRKDSYLFIGTIAPSKEHSATVEVAAIMP